MISIQASLEYNYRRMALDGAANNNDAVVSLFPFKKLFKHIHLLLNSQLMREEIALRKIYRVQTRQVGYRYVFRFHLFALVGLVLFQATSDFLARRRNIGAGCSFTGTTG